MKKLNGFTLIEVLVVVAIISILAAFTFANFKDAGALSRDIERKADLRTLQSAVELYKLKNGRYPLGCNPPGGWSGEVGSGEECPAGNGQYILDLAPEFIPVLPTDPKLNGDEVKSGYMYVTDTAGEVYKLMVKNTVEAENIGWGHPFKICDVTTDSSGICDTTHPSGKPIHCSEPDMSFGPTEEDIDMSNKDTVYDSSYAVWGGFSSRPGIGSYTDSYTEDIICDLP